MKKILPILVALLVISGCTSTNKKSKRSSSNDEVTSENVSSIHPETSITNQSSNNPTSVVTSISNVSPTTGTSYFPTTASKTSSSSITTSTSTSQSWTLPNNYIIFDPPTNTPIEIATSTSTADWWNNDLRYDFPTDDWAHIYGENLTTPKFYDNEAGGLRMDQKFKGFRTPRFHHTGAKLEIRLGISQVNTAGGETDKKVPTAYLFFYDASGNYISNLTKTVEQETITLKTTEVQIYVTGSNIENVSYFEFRLNALTFKGSQNYNFGIGSVGVHSWTYA